MPGYVLGIWANLAAHNRHCRPGRAVSTGPALLDFKDFSHLQYSSGSKLMRAERPSSPEFIRTPKQFKSLASETGSRAFILEYTRQVLAPQDLCQNWHRGRARLPGAPGQECASESRSWPYRRVSHDTATGGRLRPGVALWP